MKTENSMKQPKVRVFLAGLATICTMLLLVNYVAGQRSDFEARSPFGGAAEQPSVPTGGIVDESVAGLDTLTPSSCRYGVGYLSGFYTSLAWVSTLNAGWYVNFGATTGEAQANSAAFAPVIRIHQNRDPEPNGVRLATYTFTPPLVHETGGYNLGSLIAANPGNFWIVGNEVDVDNPTQDNIMPEIYARAYHDAYHFIKRIDPTAKVAIAGLSMMTPGRLQYLTIVWDTYRALYGVDMPVDIWNMHLYILEEKNIGKDDNGNDIIVYGDGKIALGTDPAFAKYGSGGQAHLCPDPKKPDTPENDPRADVHCRSEHDSVRIFREQVTAMRQWMKERGQQNKPLIISEMGLLYPYVDKNDQPLDGGQCDDDTYLRDEFGRCFDPNRVTTYLNNTFAFLESAKDPGLGYPADEGRLVQQWLWYSIVTKPVWSGGSSNLIANNYNNFTPGDPAALTMMGNRYRQWAAGQMGDSNLTGGVAQDVVASVSPSRPAASVNLTASFRNSGTRSVIQPFKITFYSDQNLTNEIGSTLYDPNAAGAVVG